MVNLNSWWKICHSSYIHKAEYYSMCVNTEHQQLLGSITLSFKNSADMNKYYGIGIIQGDQESGSDLHLRSYGY